MKNILAIVKKELKAIFRSKRMFFNIVILPGLLIFLVYTIMGKAIGNRFDGSKDSYDICIIESAPESFVNTLKEQFNIEYIKGDDVTTYKQEIFDGKLDAMISFPSNYDELVANHQVFDVGVYYNPSEPTSSTAMQMLNVLLEQYNKTIMIEEFGSNTIFTINQSGDDFEIYDENASNAKMIALVLPLILVMMLFSASMSITPESIAGEKERGTIATLLVTQVKRYQVAIGKIFALSLVSIMSGLSSFLGMILSMPSLMGVDGVSYSAGAILLLLVQIIVLVSLITAFLALISAFAKTVKEATTMSAPLMILAMLSAFSTMVLSDIPGNTILYFIPIFNSANSIAAILSLQISYTNLIVSIVSNICYLGISVLILTKLFNNERVMFSRG